VSCSLPSPSIPSTKHARYQTRAPTAGDSQARVSMDLCESVRRASNGRKRDSIRDSVPTGRATVSRWMCCGVRSRAHSGGSPHFRRSSAIQTRLPSSDASNTSASRDRGRGWGPEVRAEIREILGSVALSGFDPRSSGLRLRWTRMTRGCKRVGGLVGGRGDITQQLPPDFEKQKHLLGIFDAAGRMLRSGVTLGPRTMARSTLRPVGFGRGRGRTQRCGYGTGGGPRVDIVGTEHYCEAWQHLQLCHRADPRPLERRDPGCAGFCPASRAC